MKVRLAKLADGDVLGITLSHCVTGKRCCPSCNCFWGSCPASRYNHCQLTMLQLIALSKAKARFYSSKGAGCHYWCRWHALAAVPGSLCCSLQASHARVISLGLLSRAWST